MTFRCRICGSEGAWPEFMVKEMMLGTGDSFAYFQCGQCRCLQIAEIPEDIGRYYPANYYSFSTTSREKTDNALVQWFRNVRTRASVTKNISGLILRSLFAHRKLLTLKDLDITVDSRILDVGCGSGWRLYALREAGFVNTLGIDPFLKTDITYANGLQVLKRTVQEVDGEWDVIMYHHSFEHVPDQSGTLQATAELLRPGGTCLIRVPTVSSYAWDHYREHWYQIDAPRHYYLHSLESMDLLSGQAGLRIRNVSFDSTVDQFRASELCKSGIPLVRGGAFTGKQVRRWKRQARKLNRERRGDQAAFYLQKDQT